MPSITNVIEHDIFRQRVTPALIDIFTTLFGLDVIIYEPDDRDVISGEIKSIYTDVYQTYDGIPAIKDGTLKETSLLMSQEPVEFTSVSFSDVGPSNPMFVFRKAQDLLVPGSVILMKRDDLKEIRFKVEDPTTIGTVTDIVYKYPLANFE